MRRILSLIATMIVATSLMINPTYAMFDGYEDSMISGEQNIAVFDKANILESEEEEALLELGKDCANEIGIDIVFLTSDNTGGLSPTEYCDTIHDSLVADLGFSRNQIICYLHLDKSWDGYEYDHLNCYEKAIDKISEVEAEKVLDAAFNVDKYNYYGRLSAICVNAEKYYKLPTYADTVILGFFPVSYYVLLFGAVVSIVIGIVIVGKHNYANRKTSAVRYIDTGDISVTDRDVNLIRTYDTVSRGYYKQSSSGGSRSSGVHRTSGGSRSRGSSRRR